MTGTSESTLAEQFAGAFAWWREAGVEADFSDEPVNWLAQGPTAQKPAPKPASQSSAPARAELAETNARRNPATPALPRIGGDPASWPQDLAAFHDWWRTEPSLDPAPPANRIPPRGAAGAPVMLLVAQPEAEDRESLLSGPQGRLIAAMLAAMGVAEPQAYIASVLPRHTPLPDWQALGQAGIAEIARHHVALVSPARLILFGDNILSLFGNDPTQKAKILPFLTRKGESVPALGAPDPGALIGRAKWKAAFWQRWLEWTGTETA